MVDPKTRRGQPMPKRTFSGKCLVVIGSTVTIDNESRTLSRKTVIRIRQGGPGISGGACGPQRRFARKPVPSSATTISTSPFRCAHGHR